MYMPSSELHQKIMDLSDGYRNAQDIADLIGKSKSHVQAMIHKLGLPKVKMKKGFALNPKKRTLENEEIVQRIIGLSDGLRTSKEISRIVETSHKYVQDIMNTLDLPRRNQGGPTGELNGSFSGGRCIDLDGYVLLIAPDNHPYARASGRILEHRLVMEQVLGRYLLPSEVVDHKDCVHLHNHPLNLRLFASNKDHLQATISGQVPQWSAEGYQKMCVSPDVRLAHPLVDNYYDRRKCGDVRLQQILLAWLSLDKDSPYLLGTHRWLEQAGISDLSHSNLQLHLQPLSQQ